MYSVFAVEVTDARVDIISLGQAPVPSSIWAVEEAILVGSCAGFDVQIVGASSVNLGLDVRVEVLQLNVDVLPRVNKNEQR